MIIYFKHCHGIWPLPSIPTYCKMCICAIMTLLSTTMNNAAAHNWSHKYLIFPINSVIDRISFVRECGIYCVQSTRTKWIRYYCVKSYEMLIYLYQFNWPVVYPTGQWIYFTDIYLIWPQNLYKQDLTRFYVELWDE